MFNIGDVVVIHTEDIEMCRNLNISMSAAEHRLNKKMAIIQHNSSFGDIDECYVVQVPSDDNKLWIIHESMMSYVSTQERVLCEVMRG